MKQISESKKRYWNIFEESFDGLFITTPLGKILDMNRKGIKMLGYGTKKEILNLDLEKDVYVNPSDRQRILSMINAQGAAEYEVMVKRKNGKAIMTYCSLTAIQDMKGEITSYRGIIRDITKQKETEKHLLKLNRNYTLLSHINQTIIRVHETKALLNEVCRITVEYGKFRMAWIGMVNLQTSKVDVVASSGAVKDFFKKINVDLNDEYLNNEPSRIAIKTNKYRILNNIRQKSSMISWRDNAIKYDYRSVASFPLKIFNGVVGVFNIYSDETDFFYEDDIKLFDEIAMDISFALESIEIEIERKRAEEALKENNHIKSELLEKLNESQHIAMIGSWEWNLQTNNVWWSDETYRIFGVTQQDFTPDFEANRKFFHPEDFTEYSKSFEHSLQTGEPLDIDTRLVANDGLLKYCNCKGKIIYDDSGQVNCFIGTILDMTERKQSEKEREALHAIVEAINATVDFNEFLQNIYGSIKNVMYAENCFVALYDASTETISFPLFVDQLDPAPAPRSKQKGLTEYVLNTAKPLLLTPQLFDELIRDHKVELMGSPPESWIGVPLLVQSKPIGVLVVQSYEPRKIYTNREKEVLAMIGNQVAMAIERKRAKEHIRQLSIAVEQSPISIEITDLTPKIVYANSKYFESTGYEFEELIGKNPAVIKSGLTPIEKYRELWDTILSGKVWRGEFYNKKKSGELYWEDASITPITDDNGKTTHYLAIKEDITERKKMIAELIIAKEKAEESDYLKTAFLHNISHEIRTPLNAIVGFSVLITEPDLLPEKREYFSSLILKSSDHLLSIISDILSIATVDAGQEKISEKEFDLNSTLRVLYKQFNQNVQEQNLPIDLTLLLPNHETIIIADKSKLVQVLTILINNALKFTLKGSVNIGYCVKGNEVEFFVEDTGIGISPDLHQIIFERFRQVEGIAQQFGGTGLGLSISKAYVELMSGKIWLKSDSGKGSTFYFTIPHIKAHETNLSVNHSPMELLNETKAAITILVAEDEDSNFILIEEFISDLNAKIIRAINGIEAVNICKSNQGIDLILMDIKMPLMDGDEAIKQIRNFMPNLPIIAQTAYSTETEKKSILAYGCNDFISKPIKKELLISKIREHIGFKTL